MNKKSNSNPMRKIKKNRKNEYESNDESFNKKAEKKFHPISILTFNKFFTLKFLREFIMQYIHFPIPKNIFMMAFFIFLTQASMAFSNTNSNLIGQGGKKTQIGRYSTVQNRATSAQVNPLVAVSQFRFSANVKTVGEAVQIVLENTGYQLVHFDQRSRAVSQTLEKPLPIVDRQLGPLSIRETLTILMGQSVFQCVEDPLNRTVDFKVKPQFIKAAKALGEK